METRCRIFTVAYPSAFLAACLLAPAGCREQGSAGAAGHDDEHAGHVIPAHKPRTFPDAVRRLRELNDQIVRNTGDGRTGTSSQQKTLQVALDIANWLPEIAADCDMPEAPWNKVHAQSAALVADYQTIISTGASGNVRQRVDGAGKAIAELEALLAAADPRWFAGNQKVAGAP